MDGRKSAEPPFGEVMFGLGDEVCVAVGVGEVEDGVVVSLMVLDEDEFLEGRSLSLNDFFCRFNEGLGDGIYRQLSVSWSLGESSGHLTFC